MKKVERSALMPYSAKQMFAVVDDVATYPEFLPWCVDSEIIEDTPGEMVACLSLSKGALKQRFTTRNQKVANEIFMSLVEGPFSDLQGHWRFTQLGEDGCKIEMSLSFDFDSQLMNKTLGRVFETAADKLVDAFCQRADKLYA